MAQSKSGVEDPLQTFDWTAYESLSYAVVMAAAEASDVDPVTVEPLHTAIDGDALNSLFGSTAGQQPPTRASVEFEYLDYRVVVNAHGRGYLYERSDAAATETGPAEQPVLTDDD